MKTSYFGKSKDNPNAISIARITPRWFRGKIYIDLAPSFDLIRKYKKGIINEERYSFLYKKDILGNLDPDKVLNDLGENAVLLCYETSDKFCHRHLVAEWLMKYCDIVIEEIT